MKLLKNITITTIILFITIGSLFGASSGETADYSYGMRLYNDQVYDVCVSQFKAFLEKYPKSLQAPDAHFYIAESFLKQNKENKAIQYFQQLILNFPSAPKTEKALINLADIYKKNEQEKAARYYLQVGNYFPNATKVPEYTYEAIKIFFDLKKYKIAEENIRLLEQRHKNNYFTKKSEIILSRIYMQKKMPEMAINNYRRILRSSKVKSEYLEVAYNFSYDLLLLKKHNNALKILQNSIKKSNSVKNDYYYKSVILLSEILLQNKNYSKMNQLLKKLKNIPEKFLPAINNLKGDQAFAESKYENAFNYFYKASSKIDNENDKIINIYKMAISKERMKDLTTATDIINSYLSKVVEIKPEIKKSLKIILSKLIDLDYQMGMIGEAEDQLVKYQEFKLFSNIEMSDFKFKSAFSSYTKKRYSEALTKFILFYENNTRYKYADKVLYYAGESALILKKYNQANELFIKLKNQFPASEFYGLTIKKIDLLNKYHLKSDNIVAQIADLSARAIAINDSNKSELYYYWGKLFFFDLKDYDKSEYYLNLYLAQKSKDKVKLLESKFLQTNAQELKINSSKTDLLNIYNKYDDLVKNNSTNLPIIRKAAINQIKLRKKIENSKLISVKEICKNLLDKNFYDATGFVNYTYNKALFKEKDYIDFITNSNNFLKNFTNSTFITETIYLRAEAYSKSGNFNSANVEYKKLLLKQDSYWKMKALEKLIAFGQDDFETKITMINQLKENYYYTKQGQNANLDKAKLYLANNKLQGALEIYLNLQKKVNKQILSSRWNFLDKNYNQEIAEIFFKQKRYDLAESYYLAKLQSTISSDGQLEIFKQLNEIYTIRNDREALETNLKQLARISGSSESFYALLSLADLEFTKGNYKTAQGKYEKLLKTKGIEVKDKLLINRKIIKSMLRRDRITKAVKEFKNLKKKFKKIYLEQEIEPEFIIEKADAYLHIKKYTKALKMYDDLDDDYENSEFMSRALYGQSRVYLNIGKKEKSYALLEKIIKKYPDSEESIKAKYQLSDIYLNQEKYDVALKYLEPILNADNHEKLQRSAYKKIIDLYIKLGLNDAASRTIRQYVLRFPEEDDVFQKRIEIGNIYQRNGEYDKALEYFNSLLLEASGDNEAAVQFFISETYMQKKSYRRAISEFLKVKYLIKNSSTLDWGTTALYKASQCYEKLHEPLKAIKLLEQVSKKYQQNTKYGRYARKEIKRLKKLQ